MTVPKHRSILLARRREDESNLGGVRFSFITYRSSDAAPSRGRLETSLSTVNSAGAKSQSVPLGRRTGAVKRLPIVIITILAALLVEVDPILWTGIEAC